ncbi:hypothetical protein J437_LFUL011398 [Ladona fulva]|uniref:AGC-kinase C-terminal domain-containing protein n=1 Tax=Ladona fulva TaxID=123851 RepID=A0A8K0KD19_LADFU|nr:hypothetical protein J437_LFUL011398 [Ladona fulva]
MWNDYEQHYEKFSIVNVNNCQTLADYTNQKSSAASLNRHKECVDEVVAILEILDDFRINLELFFNNVDWIALFNQNVKPVFVPKTKDDGDSSNFDKFPEEDLRKSSKELYPTEFAEF